MIAQQSKLLELMAAHPKALAHSVGAMPGAPGTSAAHSGDADL